MYKNISDSEQEASSSCFFAENSMFFGDVFLKSKIIACFSKENTFVFDFGYEKIPSSEKVYSN
ncbi:MAG: hypothetical protein HUJ75_01240 [Parasporobacterium sp.]|nr:hypothetical protein [Parasporobacterium sp.]